MSIFSTVTRFRLSSWLRLLASFAFAALALVSLIPAEYSPPRSELPGPVEHFIAYAFASALAASALHRTIRTWQLAGAFIGYAAILEFSQRWSPGRAPNVVDFLGGSAGALAGMGVCIIVLHGVDRAKERC